MALPEAVLSPGVLYAASSWLERRPIRASADNVMTLIAGACRWSGGEADVFAGADGQVSLLDFFDGSRQLVVQHVMFDPPGDRMPELLGGAC